MKIAVWSRLTKRGIIKFLYTLKDAFGNTSKYSFVVRGRKQPIEPFNYREKYFFTWDKTNICKNRDWAWWFRKECYIKDTPLNYQVKADSGAVAFTYQINDKSIPLHAGCELRIGLRRKTVADTAKYYVARVTPKGVKYSVGGNTKTDTWRRLFVKLGTYTVAVDTVPPEIIPVNKNYWGRKWKDSLSVER